MAFISGHTHFETPWTASTQKELIKRAQELGRTHVTYTDIGRMTGVYKAYKAVTGDKKNPLKFIPGMEMMLERNGGYVTITVHCRDQEAFQAMVKVASKPRGAHKSKKTEDEYPTYYWEDIRELAKFNTTFILSGPHSIYARAMIEENQEQAVHAIDELVNMAPGRIYVSLVAASEDSVQRRYVRINNKMLIRDDCSMKTDYSDMVSVKELTRQFHSHKVIHGFYAGYRYIPLDKPVDFKKAKEETKMCKLQIGDAIKKANLLHFQLAVKRGLKILVTDYAFMAHADDRVVQGIRSKGLELQPTYFMMSDEEATQALSNHGIPVSFINKALANTQEWAETFNSFKLKYDWRLPKITEKPTKTYIMELIKKVGRMRWGDPVYVERLKYEIGLFVDNGEFDFGPYFFPIAKIFDHYRENGQLTGPGRGSVTGSLMSYCMGFTHIDPIEYDLPFERFFSMDRIKAKKLPDVDVDLGSRNLLVGDDAMSGLLYKMFGNKAAQISTRGTLRLKSSIQDVNRVRNGGEVEPEIEKFTEALAAPPQGVSDQDWIFGFKDSDGNVLKGLLETSEALQDYVAKRPEEWSIVRKMLAIPRQNGRHASAFVIADVPITDVIPTMTVGDVNCVTQYEAKEVESAGLIKYDFLCLLQLLDVEGTLKRINEKNGKLGTDINDVVGWWHSESDSGECSDCCHPIEFCKNVNDGLVDLIQRGEADTKGIICTACHKPMANAGTYEMGWFDHGGVKTYIWDLPKTDDKTAHLMARGDLAGLFQISTNSMTPVVIDIQPKNIVDVAIVQALVRPGPMDYIDEKLGINMVQKYIKLSKGEIEQDNKLLLELLPESYGVIVFQENLTKIAKKLAGMSGERAEILRDNMCKKRLTELLAMKPEFMEGALKNASQEDCETIWGMMETFGQYGFSINHATAYAAITWATAFLKAHYPLEFWASILTNADQKEINEKFWKHCSHLILPPDINLSTDQMVVDYSTEKIRSKLNVIRGLGEKTLTPILAGRPYSDIEDFVRKDVAGDALIKRLIHVGIMDSLFPVGSYMLDKMQLYADAVEKVEHEKKMSEYKEKHLEYCRAMDQYEKDVEMPDFKPKKPREPKKPEIKKGSIDPKYLTLHPYEDFSLKKDTLPSMPLELTNLVLEISDNVIGNNGNTPKIQASNGKTSRLINGGIAQLYEERRDLDEDDYFVCAGLVVSLKEKTMKKKGSKFLTVVIDSDGFMREQVKWPDYNTNELTYPPLKKGDIAFFFYGQRPGKPPRIMDIVVEHNKLK